MSDPGSQGGLDVFNTGSWLAHLGALGVFTAMFCETGLLIGVVLPGDSMLFTAGALCGAAGRSAHADLAQVLLAAATGAILGAQVGYYWLGQRAGRAVLAHHANPRADQHLSRAARLLERFGPGRAIFLARFIPLARTMINPLSGILRVPYRTFVTSQILGGLTWSFGVTAAGYGLGGHLPALGSWLRALALVAVPALTVPAGLGICRLKPRAADARPAAASEHQHEPDLAMGE
jgi:membrane-associated protein